MQFGFFDDANREYVINTPFTPLPWINYLGSEDFFDLVSNTLGGYAFYRDAKLQRLLRYRYNGVPADIGGRFYYIKEHNEAKWNPGFLPARTELDAYECRHGLGYTRFLSEKKGLKARLTLFVPLGEACEIYDLMLTNNSGEEKQIQVYGCMEFCLWNAVDDVQNFQRNLNIAESEIESSVIYHCTEYRERRNHYAYYGVNAATAGFDTDRSSFLGHMGDWSDPKAVHEETSYSSHITGWYPIACHRLDLTLKPGESFRTAFVLGYGENPKAEKFLPEAFIDDLRRQGIPLFDHRGDVGLQGIQEVVLFAEHLIDGLNGNFLQELLVDRPGVAGVTCGLKPRAAAPDNGLAAPVVPVDAPEEFTTVAAENNLGKAVIA